MNILNIINTIFGKSNFIKVLGITFVGLIFVFLIILYLAYKDAHKTNEPKIKWYKKFENKKELKKIKEDVTLEMPVISENLKQYKMNIEEAISNDDKYDEIKPLIQDIKIKAPKNTKVLDIDKIEETFVEPTFEMANGHRISKDDFDMQLPKERK